MTRQNALVLAAVAAFTFLAGLGVGRVLPQGPWFSGKQGQETQAGSGESNFGFQKVRGESARRQAPAVVKGFQYLRLDLDMSGEAPKACFQFSQKLDESARTNYADYVRLSGGKKPVVTVNGQTLCVAGLEFDADYRATLRAGLPSARGETLPRAEEVTIAFGDKPAFVGFVGDGVVLPRLEADGVGIETVNVETVKVTVRRVSDRSLARKEIVKGGSVADEDYYYVWEGESGEDVGVVVYEGEIKTKADRNQTKTTVFPLGAALKALKPGAYFVNLKDISPGADASRSAQAWRWVMFTDIAITTYSSGVGIDVVARSLSTAKPMTGLKLVLVAENNDELAVVTTDKDGKARFSEAVVSGAAPLTPRMIMAYGPQNDFAALDLRRSPLDLSDRGVDGRAAPSKVDSFLWLDRGIYRPGETVKISGLLRDDSGKAVANRPATVIIRRPNFTEAEKRRIEKTDLGGFSIDFAVPAAAPRGVWSIEVQADGAQSAVGAETFSVEDFVPQRLEVTLAVDEKSPIRIGQQRQVGVSSRFLYGAPASGLQVEAEARLRLDPNPFPDHAGYRYGPADANFEERFIKLPGATLDAKGGANLTLALDGVQPGAGTPLRADLVVGVAEPGGRVVRESARIPVRADERYLGLKLADGGSGFEERTPAAIDAIMLGWDGKAIAADIEWRIVEEDYWFDWYRENGEWRWRRSYKDVLVAEGKAATSAAQPAKITQALEAGSYRLVATDVKSGAKTDQRFYVGWRSYESGAESPDQASLTGPTKPVAPGSTVKLILDPPYAGEAIIAVATDKVHSVQRLKIDNKATEISVQTDPSWGGGFYVLATVVTPRDAAERPVPRRAMGVAYVPFDMGGRTLTVGVGAPKLARPRQKLDVPVTISGARGGEQVRLTLAAVDEGILRLTKFTSPDPAGHFFGKKALGVEIRDDYGRILNANLGAATKFGGDQLGGEGLTVVPTKSVALFSGVVKLGPGGKATVPVDVPDFNGELRLMAVAWSGDKLGASTQPMTVRDPVPAELALPRFLAPGDRADTTLLIDNVDGSPGAYQVAVKGDGPVGLNASQSFTLNKGQKQTQRFALQSGEAGIGSVTLSAKGPGNFAVSRSYPIQVRSPYYPQTEISTAALAPGESFTTDAGLIAAFLPGSTDVTVSFSRLRGVEPGPLLDALYRYPYGCSEQLTSAALPLLFVDVLGGEAGRGPERAVRPRVQKAINQLLERQSADGAFGLWAEGDGWASPWLGAYVTDFLDRAKQQGYAVPDEALDRSYKALAQIAKIDRWVNARYNLTVYDGPGTDDTTDDMRRRAAAYALYVLARAGRADLSDLRYFHDAVLDKTKGPLPRAQIGAALALLGDRARAKSAFDKAINATGYVSTGDYYQTPLRDLAGLLALAAEAGRTAQVDQIAERFSGSVPSPDEMHTQEKAFVLLASQALLKTSGPVLLSRDGKKLEKIPPAPSFALSAPELQKGAAWRNDGTGPIYRTVTVSGAPRSAPPPIAEGVAVQKAIFTREGAPADLNAVRQNDRLVVVISGGATAARQHQLVIADLLPSGFEIEAVLKPEDGSQSGVSGPYAWAGDLSQTQIAEARDDRFVAALSVSDNSFRMAYLVRAVTPGSFVLPGVVVEDMYRPSVSGRSAAGRVTIAASQ